MNWHFGPHLWPLVGSVALMAAFARGIWPVRRAPGARTLLTLLLASAAWSLTDLLQYGCYTLERKLVLENLVYIWVGVTPVLWIYFVLQHTAMRRRLRSSEIASLLLIPAIGIILAFANPTSGAIRKDVSLLVSDGLATIKKSYGPYFWVMAIYLHGLTLAGAVLLLRHTARTGRIWSRQGIMLGTAAVLPILANLAYLLTNRTHLHIIDPTPIAVSISGALLVVALRRVAVFSLDRAGREVTVATMRDGWIVIDASDRIVTLNPAARDILVRNGVVSARSADLAGRRMSILSPELSPMLRAQMGAPALEQPVIAGRGAAARHYRVSQTEIRNRYNEPSGTVLTLQDVTWQSASDRERAEMVEALNRAQTQVAELIALLPHCPACGQIRVDEPYRARLDDYLQRHPDIRSRLPLCPRCSGPAASPDSPLPSDGDPANAAQTSEGEGSPAP